MTDTRKESHMAAEPDSGISIRGITKSFDGTRVLKDIDLEIARGETWGAAQVGSLFDIDKIGKQVVPLILH